MSTTLTIPNTFTPLTKIRSADVNANFTAISGRVNWAGGSDATTGLGNDNIQSNNVSGGGLTRSSKLKAGTASYVLINDGSGLMSEEVLLSTTRGGLGFAPTISASTAGQILAVNPSGTGLQLTITPNLPAANIFNYYNFS